MNPHPFTLECTNTGRWWGFATLVQAKRAAVDHGLTVYTIEEAST